MSEEFRIRTITAGVELRSASDLDQIHLAINFMRKARSQFSDLYEVQSTRISTQPLLHYLPSWLSTDSLDIIRVLDQVTADAQSSLNIGPILTPDEPAPGFGSWAADMVHATSNTSFSSFIASRENGVHLHSIRAAADAIAAIANSSQGGEGNFRFCASAFCPPGTPFFPAAYHVGQNAFSVGLESPRLLQAALEGTMSPLDAEQSMRSRLEIKVISG